MSTYFVYRSHYEGPAGKSVRRVDADTVLAWFQAAWEPAKAANEADEWVDAALGVSPYGFGSIFTKARELGLPAPKSDIQLKKYLTEHLYVESELQYKPHLLEVWTNDDEIELAYFFFDDHYLAKHPGRAAYLLHDDWKLPTGSAAGPWKSSIPTQPLTPARRQPGTTYLALLTFSDSLNLCDLEGAWRLNGVRVPDLGSYLVASTPDDSWPLELKLLRAQLDPADPDLAQGFAAVARFPILRITGHMMHHKLGRGTPAKARAEFAKLLARFTNEGHTNDPAQSLIHVDDHLAQLCLNIDEQSKMFHQWILFDDLWASAHSDLAAGVLRYAQRWDVL